MPAPAPQKKMRHGSITPKLRFCTRSLGYNSIGIFFRCLRSNRIVFLFFALTLGQKYVTLCLVHFGKIVATFSGRWSRCNIHFPFSVCGEEYLLSVDPGFSLATRLAPQDKNGAMADMMISRTILSSPPSSGRRSWKICNASIGAFPHASVCRNKGIFDLDTTGHARNLFPKIEHCT